MRKVYIRSSVLLSGPDPDFRQYIPPMQARRLGPLLKRALVSALTALEKAGVAVPDAILSGTGLGCMETTERVLDSLKTGEEGCSPTDFMQSTHNTIASTIAIRLGCSGYNCSYSQGDVSFENALLDAWLLIASGEAETALVCANDEMTERTCQRLAACGYLHGEARGLSAAFVLSSRAEGALCELASVEIFHGQAPDAPSAEQVLTPAQWLPRYGQCPVSSAAGAYMGVEALQAGAAGPVLIWQDPEPDGSAVLLQKTHPSCSN